MAAKEHLERITNMFLCGGELKSQAEHACKAATVITEETSKLSS